MSQCCVAVNRRNGIETVAIDNNGERVLPSFVAYDEIHEKCGQVVVDRLRFHSESTVFDSKRIIGRNFEEIEIDTMWPFYLNSDKNKPFIKIRNYKKELVSKSAEQVAASLLKYIRKKTEEFQGKRLHRAVITVPASFTNTQKNSTRSAASLAGWDSVYLLSEPVAASFTYFVNQEAPNNTILLLFDLGGGTLDVCLSKIKDNKIITISNSGNSQVGGRNFDNILIKYFIEKLKNDFDITVADGKKYKLILECQKIKHSLSVQMQEALDVEDFDIAKEGFIKIDRQIFETLSQDLLTNIKDAIKNTLYYSGHKAHKINKVLLVGGSCRMPMIKKLLQDMFPNSEHCCDEHPEEVVAIGAAYFAYNYFFA
uniref:Heat shock protein 70 n=1 Tax=Panagrolaimus davidi TaxID=227884 RepID=A0A914PF46_9BILA